MLRVFDFMFFNVLKISEYATQGDKNLAGAHARTKELVPALPEASKRAPWPGAVRQELFHGVSSAHLPGLVQHASGAVLSSASSASSVVSFHYHFL